MIVTLAETLSWLGVASQYFTITADNDGLILTSDQGSATIDVPDGTYEASDLATALQTAMNADNTLTGTGTIIFAVSYSSEKFTLDATAGHTIAYTHSGSDGGLTFGFNQDHSASQTITSDLSAGDPTSDVEQILDGVDLWVKEKCYKGEIEADDFVEYYDGADSIWVKNAPIISIDRITIGTRAGITITNSSTDMVYGMVSIDDTNVTLKVVGGANAGTDTVAFATYDDLGEIVDAINALGHGWTAVLYDSDYADFPYTELIELTGLRILDSTYYLQIPEDQEIDYKVNAQTGQIQGSFPKGFRNVRVQYRGGWETIPENTKYGVLVLIKFLYDKKQEESSGVVAYTVTGITKEFERGIPEDAKRMLPWRPNI